MLLIHSLKLCYVRVPKTGSTSFVNALDELDPETLAGVHDNATGLKTHLRRRLGDQWNTYQRVGFIRHPYQWARSAYNHWKRNPDMFQVGKPNSLETFVKQLRKTPYEWLCDEDGKLFCDIWFTEDMPEIMQLMGLDLHHKNVKFEAPFVPDRNEKRTIRERFRKDFIAGSYEA